MKKLFLFVACIFSGLLLAQEGEIIWKKGEDLSYFVKKTKMQINIHVDSTTVNNMTQDSMLNYIIPLYNQNGGTMGNTMPDRWKKYKTEHFPRFFSNELGKRLEKIKVESGTDIKAPNLVMDVYMIRTQVKNMNPPGMSTSSSTDFRITISKAENISEVVAIIYMNKIPGGILPLSSDNFWMGNIKHGCKRAGEMLGDYIIQNKK